MSREHAYSDISVGRRPHPSPSQALWRPGVVSVPVTQTAGLGQDGKPSLWNGNAGPQQRAPNSALPLPGMNMGQVPEPSIPTRQRTRMKDEAQRQIVATLEETQRRNEAHLNKVKSTGMTDFQRTMVKAAADSDKPPPKLQDIPQHTPACPFTIRSSLPKG